MLSTAALFRGPGFPLSIEPIALDEPLAPRAPNSTAKGTICYARRYSNQRGEYQGVVGRCIASSLALQVRRLHDIDRSGWWLLLALTGIGIVLLLCWAGQEGVPYDNRFGPNPLAHRGHRARPAV